jgi:hypothetical protein
MTYLTVTSSEEAQMGLLFVPFLVADIPISFLFGLDFVGKDGLLGAVPWLRDIVFSPVLIFGIFGSIWWYFIPKFFLPKRSGGIWGERLPKNTG